MINFKKHGLKHQKTPNMNSSENTQCNAWNHEIKCERKGIRVLPALGDKNLAKIPEENDKKSLVEPSQIEERERKLGKVLKKWLWKSPIWLLKKHDSRVSIDQRLSQTYLKIFDWSKNRMDRSKRVEAH